MKRSILSFLLVAAMLFTVFCVPFSASAAVDLTNTNLNTVQKYYLRLIGSLARADYYQTDVLASVTLSQAIYEGGWGRYSLPVGGNNLFGIKAYNTWPGRVYDQRTSMLYESYDDFVLSVGQSHVNTISAWRAHKNWAESVAVHSNLFIQETKYAKVIGEKDYAVAAREIVNAGYCDDDGYAETVIKLIEQYGLTEYDDLTPDEDGIVAITTDPERKLLDIGETYTVPLTYYPAETTASAISWASDNEEVATVDENGVVTALSHGMTLITATLANGREACLIVYVDCNATIIDKDAEIYKSASVNSETDGKIYRGTAMKVTDETKIYDGEGNAFYKVEGFNSKGVYVSGYALAEYVYLNKRYVSNIAIVKNDITIKPGDEYTVRTAISPADATDTVLTWSSDNENVAEVTENGVIIAKEFGNATITATAVGGTSQTVNVSVAPFYKEYKGIVTSYETLIVRAEPNAESTRVGKLDFLSEITVIGEPDGVWYKVSGKDSSGKAISGYSNSAYVRLVSDDYSVTYATAGENIRIYKECDVNSMTYGVLASGTRYAIVADAEGNWDYIVGLKNPSDYKAIHGYADLTSVPIIPNPPDDPDVPTEGYYGITQSDLNVRSGAGTGFDSVGRFASGTRIVIIGEKENGWYRVYGIGTDGEEISGYSSADYIVLLYSGTVNATTLNVRSEPSTSGNVVGQFKNGESVVVIGDAESNWYSVESVDGSIKGYCSADYIVRTGLLTTEVKLPEEEDFAILDATLSIDSGILNGVRLETTAEKLLSCFSGNVSIVDPLGTPIEANATVGTGCKLLVSKDGSTESVATVLVLGDTDGDGEVSIYDYLRVKRHFMGTYKLEGAFLKAALLSGKGKVTVADYVLIKRLYAGTYTIK